MDERDSTSTLDAVLARFLDGEPEPGDGERLAVAMKEDSTFAQEVVRLLTVDDLLRQCAVPDEQAFVEALRLRLGDEESDGGAFTAAFQRRLQEDGSPRSAFARRGLVWVTAIAASVVLLALGGWALRIPGPARLEPRGRGVAEPRRVAQGDGLALVLRLEGAEWEPDAELRPLEGELLGGGRLRLRSGRVTLSMLTGVALVVEGPADFELLASDRVYCRRGRFRARVPKGAEGFVVASAASAVVDLGTEFALNLEPDGKARVMVFEGLAEVALLDAQGAPKRTQLVVESKSFDLDPGGDRIAEAVARPEGFVSPIEKAVPALLLPPAYASAVRALRPRAYWRFESIVDGQTPNDVAGAPPLRLHGPVQALGSESGNGCVRFGPGAPDQFLGTDDPWEVAGGSDVAVEFWFLSDDFRHASIVGLLPPETLVPPDQQSRFMHNFLIETTALQRQSLNKPASVRFLSRWPLESTIGDNLFAEEVYVPRSWHHVVAQKNGDHMELFFDGRPSRLKSTTADPPTLSCRLVVGRRTLDRSDPRDVRPFVGRIDELAIYGRRLTESDVQRHFLMAVQHGPAE